MLVPSAAIEREEAELAGEVRTGFRIVARALEEPTRQIAVNSGIDPGVAVERMRQGTGNLGLDASVVTPLPACS